MYADICMYVPPLLPGGTSGGGVPASGVLAPGMSASGGPVLEPLLGLLAPTGLDTPPWRRPQTWPLSDGLWACQRRPQGEGFGGV